MIEPLPRVYPILDTASLARLGVDPLVATEAFLEGGARILQFRHKAFWSLDVFALAEQVAKLCAEAEATFILNDRADFAALLHTGLHVGQEDLTPADARRVIANSAILGFSTHNAAQMIAAAKEPVDYVAFGPIFSTTSRERPSPTTGIETLRTIRALTDKPLVAIGGITRNTAALCFEAGADSVAIIADLLPVSFPVSALKQTLRDRMTEWQKLIRR